MPDHATEAAELLAAGRTDATDVTDAAALLAIHEALAIVAWRMLRSDIRDQIINTHHVHREDHA